MKLVYAIGVFLFFGITNFAIGAEILSCNINVATPSAANLEYQGESTGVRLVREELDLSGEQNQKRFEFNLEQEGHREITLTLDRNQPTSNALLNLDFYVYDFQGDEELQTMEMWVYADAVVTLENTEYRQWNSSNLLCVKQYGCYGNFGSVIGNELHTSPASYFGFSVYCNPIQAKRTL